MDGSASLSRRKQGFESPRERHLPFAPYDFRSTLANGFGEDTIQCMMTS